MSQKPSQLRRTRDDGIHRLVETVTGDASLSLREALEIRDRLLLAVDCFDSTIARAEEKWGAVQPERHAAFPSDAWYAKHGRALIAAIRRHLQARELSRYHAEQAAVLAFRLGALAADADWRRSQGDRVRRTIQRVQVSRENAARERQSRYSAEETAEGPTNDIIDERLRSLIAAGVIVQPRTLAREWLGPLRARGQSSVDALRKRIERRLEKLRKSA